MDYLIKTYIDACTPELLKCGFARKNKAFVRVVNDVMQILVFEKLRSGRNCRVRFSIVPLCLRIEKEYIVDGVYSRYLRQFELANSREYDDWEYDPKSEESMDKCIKEIIRYINSYLLPLFDRANSCETALPELIKLEKLFNDIRLEGLRRSGIKDGACPGAEFNLIDSVKYYMALRIGDYDFALKSRGALLQQNVDAYNSVLEMGFMTEEVKRRREEGIANLREDISRLERRDEASIRQLITENEAYSLSNLKAVIKGL